MSPNDVYFSAVAEQPILVNQNLDPATLPLGIGILNKCGRGEGEGWDAPRLFLAMPTASPAQKKKVLHDFI